jgi:dipeptidyl aminopeptidase/acylaminoacyl peptidase
MKMFLIIFALVGFTHLFAQKPPLPLDAYKKWCGLFNESISDDGRFVAYQEKAADGTIFTKVITLDGSPCGDTSWYTVKEKVNHPIGNDKLSTESLGGLLPVGFTLNQNSDPQFSGDGNKLYLELVRKQTSPADQHKESSVQIWKYNDDSLPPARTISNQYYYGKPFHAVLDLKTNKLIFINSESEDITVFPPRDAKSDYALTVSSVVKIAANKKQWFLNPHYEINLVSLSTGRRETIDETTCFQIRHFSPNGKFVIGYNLAKKRYFSYHLATKTLRFLATSIKHPFYDVEDDQPGFPNPYGIAGWSKNENNVYVYDQYDIWKISLDNSSAALNVTKGYGRKKRIVLRLLSIVKSKLEMQCDNLPEIAEDSILYVAGFSKDTKKNGFFSLVVGKNTSPELLHFSDSYFSFSAVVEPSSNMELPYMPVIKAKDANTFLLRRQTASEYPNLFVTTNFRDFRQITNVQPQVNYNWVRSELVKYQDAQGRTNNAIVYKPENFDSTRKYPVIFMLYERQSDALHIFNYLDLSGGTLNIPYFVSNGYIVVAPDIRYKTGEPGKSIFLSVNALANYMTKQRWVNASRMALQGHSFGGYEVNYLLTKTKRFAAAVEVAGLCDMLSTTISE